MIDAELLIVTAAFIAMLHTAVGPDHYLPFVAMAKARDWSLAKTLRITFYCGVGHVLGSVAIGGVGIWLGSELTSLTAIEGVRGNLAGWSLLAFGLMYLAWGVRKAGQSHEHSHVHAHGDLIHDHSHNHATEHAHAHTDTGKSSLTPWALFIVFILGPCEALIPLFMYPAATASHGLVILVAVVFGVVTLLTMLGIVAALSLGLSRFSFPTLGRYSHAAAGASVAACGAAISIIGL